MRELINPSIYPPLKGEAFNCKTEKMREAMNRPKEPSPLRAERRSDSDFRTDGLYTRIPSPSSVSSATNA